MKTILKLFGFDLSDPIGLLSRLLPLIGPSKLESEIARFLKVKMSPARRAQVVADFRKIADQMEKSDDAGAAVTLVDLLAGIRG